MNRISLRRKTRFGGSRGVSSVIGTVFLVLTVLVISTNFFLWTLLQNGLYNQTVKERNQQDVDRLIENVIATNTTYIVPFTATINVTTDIVNAGSIPAQVVTLWVLDATQKKYNVTDLRASNINLNPGDRRPLSRVVQIPGAVSSNMFNAWIVTTRGNKVNLATVQSVIVADVAQGIGSMALNFYAFRYYRYATTTQLVDYSTGIISFNVPGSGTFIAFGAVLTNLDPSKQTVTLNVYSNIWLMFPGAPGQIPQFFIVNVASDGTITTSGYTPITIAYGETKLVVFASKAPVSPGPFSQNSISASITPNPSAVNLLLLGTIGSRDYGQNVPFVSLYVYKP